MKTAIRVFALLVAFVGLASASMSSNSNHALPAHMSTAVSGPQPDLPAPLPCSSDGTCVAPSR
jgi:hypothetical protein